MLLQKLELFGFKSFAERTQIRFSPGITAVVGPNGCGKSNISDAVRWAIGEQNVRALRGRTLQDVIFKGTREVKPMGVAEVSLHLDNQSKRLATEYAEVTIRRRVFRSGESEFTINKTPCRLKDIRDLFLDTGLGSAAYAVIEREMIDEVLADRDRSRRFLLDEASGITRYKQRRKETLLKLEAVAADLTRVLDALEIEEREVRSLAYQMGKARKYRRLSDAIRSLEIGLARLEWRELCAVESGESGRLSVEERQRETARTDVHRLEAEQEERRVALLAISKQLEASRQELQSLEERLGSARESAIVRRERIRALQESVAGLTERAGQTTAAKTRAEEELVALAPRIEDLAAQLAVRRRIADEVEAEWAEAERALRGARETLGRQQQLHIASVRRHSDADHRALACEERLADLEAQRERIAKQQTALSERADEIAAWLDERQARRTSLASENDELGARLHAHGEELRASRMAVESFAAAVAGAAADRARIESRLATLEEQARSYEGFRSGVAELLRHKDELRGIHGALSELLEVSTAWRERLEPVLREYTDWVATTDEPAAWAAIAWLRERGLGQVTFLPLDTCENPDDAADRGGNDAAADRGGDNAARNAGLPAPVVRAWRAEHAPIASYLAGSIIPVPGASDVPPAGARAKGKRWVTESGEVFAAEGWIMAGGRPSSEARLWQRPEEMARLTSELHAAGESCRIAEDERGQAQARCRELEEICESTRRSSEELRLEHENLARAMLQKEAEARLVREEIARLRDETTRLAAQREALEREHAALRESREQTEQEGSSTEAQFREASARVDTLATSKDDLSARLSQKRMDAVLAETQLQELTSRAEQRKTEVSEAESQLAAMRAQRERAEEEIVSTGQQVDQLAAEESELLQQRESRRRDVDRRDQERGRLEDHLAGLERDLRTRRRSLSEFEEALRENEVRLARIEAEKDALRTRSRDQYQVDLAELEAPDASGQKPTPEELLGGKTRDEAREEATALRQERERLGPVNPLAIEEHEKKQDHVRFIKEQRDDLLASKESLLAAIERINREARQLFQATFEQVQENLTRTFTTLFPGGEAQLRLAGDDPLEADVEIMARPRGKRLESIHLLSSGERALTATALLFALYLVKPSPFCLLDEVDAPLDDANIDRFLNLLRSFSDRTQFIIITHNKRSMEVADTLYGVTMQEPGISKIVSVRLEGGTLLTEDGRRAEMVATPAVAAADRSAGEGVTTREEP